jgi:hypothetical protein
MGFQRDRDAPDARGHNAARKRNVGTESIFAKILKVVEEMTRGTYVSDL